MIQTGACPRCGGQVRARDGLCPSCVMRQALDLVVSSDTPTAGRDTARGDRTLDRLTEFLAPAQGPDELGRLGSYRILNVLGHGGMGVVFRADDLGLHRQVAIKAMLPRVADVEGNRSRFLREARAAAAVRNDHVVSIYQVAEERGVPFVAMELLEGESLDERMRREPKLSIAEILRIGRETALGLTAAHEKGLVHRDIKPANIWLESKDEGRRMKDEAQSASVSSFIPHPSSFRVKILDFGLARGGSEESHITELGAIVGTPAYMAPEQARGDEPDPRSDLFSLGCVLFRLCTAASPFKGKDPLAVLSALATQTPTPPCECNPQVPRELSDYILTLLDKDPTGRPASAAEVVAALASMEATPEAIAATPTAAFVPIPTDPTELFPSPRLRVARIIGLASAAVAAAVLAVVMFWQTTNGTIRIEVKDPKIAVTLGTGNLPKRGRKASVPTGARRVARRSAGGRVPGRSGPRHRPGRSTGCGDCRRVSAPPPPDVDWQCSI